MKSSIVITIIVVLVVGSLSFFGGMQYQKSQRTQFPFGQGGVGRFQDRNGTLPNTMRNGGGGVLGEIIDRDENSITVKSNDGSSKIIMLTGKTTINKAANATNEDLKKGEKVMIFGSLNNDGSLTAQNIQLNPTARGENRPQ